MSDEERLAAAIADHVWSWAGSKDALVPSLAKILLAARDAEIERLRAALAYVADMTYCGRDAEWHVKRGYDPQFVLDALDGA